jgi:hypothetical protein
MISNRCTGAAADRGIGSAGGSRVKGPQGTVPCARAALAPANRIKSKTAPRLQNMAQSPRKTGGRLRRCARNDNLMAALHRTIREALPVSTTDPAARWPNYREADCIIQDYRFASGEVLPELRLHYRTMGVPKRDMAGKIVNGVLLQQGNTGTGANWLRPSLADALYGPGQPLDAHRYVLIMPDAIGRGGSSKPSDGLRGHFPHYRYRDMVDSVQQRHHGFHAGAISHGPQRVVQLRRLHRNPEHVDGGDLLRLVNRNREVAQQRAFQSHLGRKLPKRARTLVFACSIAHAEILRPFGSIAALLVAQQHPPVTIRLDADENVARLDVTMHNVVVVGVLERGCDLADEVRRSREFQGKLQAAAKAPANGVGE